MAKLPLRLCWLLSALVIRSYMLSLSLSLSADILLEIRFFPPGAQGMEIGRFLSP